MGGVFSAACCVSTMTCSAVCGALNACQGPTMAKLMYASILLSTLVVSVVMLTPAVQNMLVDMPFCDESTSTFQELVHRFPGEAGSFVRLKCSDVIGYLAVYRVCFVVTIFFTLMSILMIGVRNSRDARSGIQNGMWGLKYLAIIAGCIGMFFVRGGVEFSRTWMYFGLIGSMLFILVQLILIVDFAHSWAENWLAKHQDAAMDFGLGGESNLFSHPNRWFFALLACSVLMYACAVGITIFGFVYYTGISTGDCPLHEFVLSFNLILCIAISVVAVLPAVQERQANSGLLQASFVSAYVMYLTWSALTNQPDAMCNTSITAILFNEHSTDGPLTDATSNSSATVAPPADLPSSGSLDGASILGLIVWFACVLYFSIESASNSQADRLMLPGTSERDTDGGVDGVEIESGANRTRQEDDGVKYNWSLFHLMFALATVYIMMTLTNWYAPSDGSSMPTKGPLESVFVTAPGHGNTSALWVKVVSAWLCVALYVWTLIAPVLMPDRDFGTTA